MTSEHETTGEKDMIAAAAADRDQFNAETFAVLADRLDAMGARDALLRMGADAEMVDRAYNAYGGYR